MRASMKYLPSTFYFANCSRFVVVVLSFVASSLNLHCFRGFLREGNFPGKNGAPKKEKIVWINTACKDWMGNVPASWHRLPPASVA